MILLVVMSLGVSFFVDAFVPSSNNNINNIFRPHLVQTYYPNMVATNIGRSFSARRFMSEGDDENVAAKSEQSASTPPPPPPPPIPSKPESQPKNIEEVKEVIVIEEVKEVIIEEEFREEDRPRVVVPPTPPPPPQPKQQKPPQKQPPPQQQQKQFERKSLTPEEKNLAVASSVGGLVLGTLLGIAIDVENPNIDLYTSIVVPPVFSAIVLSGTGYVLGGTDGGLGNLVRKTLGGSTIAIGNAIVSVVQAIINAVVTSAKNKVKETTDDIKAIPGNIQKAAVNTATEIVDDIKATPGRVADAAVDTATEISDGIKATPGRVADAAVETATEIADGIKATPGRVADATKQAVEDAVDDTLDVVDGFVGGVKAIPQKAKAGVDSALGKPSAPQPPLVSPPPVKAKSDKKPVPPKITPQIKQKANKPLIPSIDSLKIETPKLDDPKIAPKLKIPKIPLPKVDLPKVNTPKPKTPKPKSFPSKQQPKITPPVKKSSKEVASGKSNFFFDKKSGRFFEAGGAIPPKPEKSEPSPPKIEAPKFQFPKIDVPKVNPPQAPTTPKKSEPLPPKIEAPKFRFPKIDVPKVNLPEAPTPPPKPKIDPKVEALKKKKAQEEEVKRKAKDEARKDEALKKRAESEAKAEENRLREEEAESKRKEAAEKAEEIRRQKGIEAKRKVEEAARQQQEALQAADERKAVQEQKRQEQLALEADRKRIQEQKRQEASQAADKRKAVQEQKRQEQLAVEEERKRVQEQKRQEASQVAEERKRIQKQKQDKQLQAQKIAEEKRVRSMEEKKANALKVERKRVAEKSVGQAKSRPTISLGNLFGNNSDEKESPSKVAGSSNQGKIQQKKSIVKPPQRVAEKSLGKAKTRPTISLGNLFGNTAEKKEAPPKIAAIPNKGRVQQKKLTVKSPQGVPVVSKWSQNSDGSINGKISGSPNFDDGDAITTSPVPMGATSNSIVITSSGSKYFLEQEETKTSFGFGFGAKKEVKTDAEKTIVPLPVEEKQTSFGFGFGAKKEANVVEEKTNVPSPAAVAAKKKKEAAGKARRQVEERKRVQEQKRQEQLEIKQRAEEKRNQLAQEKKMKEAEAKRKSQIAADAKKKAADKRKSAAQVAKKNAAMNLSSKQPARNAAQAPKIERPPAGVPVIKNWKPRGDGGVSGLIYGSPSFNDGEVVETSSIVKGKIENGSVVSTKSKSRYFLSAETTVKKSNIMAAFKDLAGAAPGATITLTKERKEKEAKASIKAIEKAQPGATFSLFGLGFGSADEGLSSPQPSPKAVANKNVGKKKKKKIPLNVVAPEGVPTVSKWNQNRDGTITGIISGSINFDEGERVTTSAISKGKIAQNEVVTTGSGSRYFLA